MNEWLRVQLSNNTKTAFISSYFMTSDGAVQNQIAKRWFPHGGAFSKPLITPGVWGSHCSWTWIQGNTHLKQLDVHHADSGRVRGYNHVHPDIDENLVRMVNFAAQGSQSQKLRRTYGQYRNGTGISDIKGITQQTNDDDCGFIACADMVDFAAWCEDGGAPENFVPKLHTVADIQGLRLEVVICPGVTIATER